MLRPITTALALTIRKQIINIKIIIKMKKYLISLAAVLFAALLTTTVFTSCSSDDDNDAPKAAVLSKVQVKYTIKSTQATLDAFKVNMYGTGADVTDIIETISATEYSKVVEIPANLLPCQIHLYTNVTPLDAEGSVNDIDFQIHRELQVIGIMSDNSATGLFGKGNADIYNLPGDYKTAEIARKVNGNRKKLVFSIDAQGKATAVTE